MFANLIIVLALVSQQNNQSPNLNRLALPEPSFPVQERQSLPVPDLDPEPQEFIQYTEKQGAIGWHVHRCPDCGHEWSHTDVNKGNAPAHTCEGCEKLLPWPWKVYQENTRIVVRSIQKITYSDLLKRVKKNQSEIITVAVGVKSKADFYVESIPDTSSGIYQCFMLDGVPSMKAP